MADSNAARSIHKTRGSAIRSVHRFLFDHFCGDPESLIEVHTVDLGNSPTGHGTTPPDVPPPPTEDALSLPKNAASRKTLSVVGIKGSTFSLADMLSPGSSGFQLSIRRIVLQKCRSFLLRHLKSPDDGLAVPGQVLPETVKGVRADRRGWIR